MSKKIHQTLLFHTSTFQRVPVGGAVQNILAKMVHPPTWRAKIVHPLFGAHPDGTRRRLIREHPVDSFPILTRVFPIEL